MLSQKTVQHEAVLATLAALSHPPAPERLYPSLRPSLPQLLGWASCATAPGPAACRRPPAWTPPWRRRARRSSRHAAGGRGALLAGGSVQLELLLDARQLLQDGDVPDALANLSLSIGPEPLCACWRARTPARTAGRCRCRNRWAASQPFALRSERVLTPASWPWAQWLAWAAASALLVAGAAAWRRGRAEAAPTRAGPRGGHGTPGHAGRDGRGHRPRAEPAADRHPGSRPAPPNACWTTKTNGLPRGPAGQRRPGPPRGRHHRPHARWCAPARPPRARRWIPRRWRIRCASCASRSWRAGRAPGVAQRRPANARWATAWRWNRSCTTWCRTPSTRWPACAPAPPARG